MRRWLERLASLQVTVAVVIVLGIVLAAGTILESLHGAVAAKAIYESPVFYALLVFFGLNLSAALVTRWPKTRKRIGFAVTHLAIVVILIGATMTALYKVEGQMPLHQGEDSRTVHQSPGKEGPRSFELPFTVHLDAFEMEFYPGTRRPSQFRSRVTVLDAGASTAGVIQMNQPLDHGGYRFFQSSYRDDQGQPMTILSVARDPGQPVVFLGYYTLIAGMILVFATRLTTAREMAARKVAAGIALALLAAAPVAAAEIPEAGVVERLRGLAVQHDGRTMPFDTEAREAVWTVTGKRAWPGIDPVAMAAGWAFDGAAWSGEPMVKVGGAEVAELVGLPPGTRYASFRQLVESAPLRTALGAAHERQAAEEKPTPADKQLLRLEERLGMLDGFFRGEAIHPLPAADPAAPWSAARVASAAALADLGDRLRAGGAPAAYPAPAALERELRYNARRPSRVAWILFLAAAVAGGLALRAGRSRIFWLAAAVEFSPFRVLTAGAMIAFSTW
jgi:hypothetical protein